MYGVKWPFESNPIEVNVDAGMSFRGADLDNVIKPILDTYQLIFPEFNDNKVYKIQLHKSIVPKGEEYITITLEDYKQKED